MSRICILSSKSPGKILPKNLISRERAAAKPQENRNKTCNFDDYKRQKVTPKDIRGNPGASMYNAGQRLKDEDVRRRLK